MDRMLSHAVRLGYLIGRAVSHRNMFIDDARVEARADNPDTAQVYVNAARHHNRSLIRYLRELREAAP